MSKHIWAIRVRLEISENHRDLALFNLAIDSKLRGCDLVKLKVADVYASGHVKERAAITQSKTRKPVRFGITEGTSKSLSRWMITFRGELFVHRNKHQYFTLQGALKDLLRADRREFGGQYRRLYMKSAACVLVYLLAHFRCRVGPKLPLKLNCDAALQLL